MSWKDYLTENERLQIEIYASLRKSLTRDYRRIYDRCRKRMGKGAEQMNEWRYVLDCLSGGYAPGLDRNKIYEFRRGDSNTSALFRLADCHPCFNIGGGLMFREPPSDRILNAE